MNKIKELLEEKGISQRELAEMVGITEVSMSRYINGERTPKAPIAMKIARVLDVNIEDLFPGICPSDEQAGRDYEAEFNNACDHIRQLEMQNKDLELKNRILSDANCRLKGRIEGLEFAIRCNGVSGAEIQQ